MKTKRRDVGVDPRHTKLVYQYRKMLKSQQPKSVDKTSQPKKDFQPKHNKNTVKRTNNILNAHKKGLKLIEDKKEKANEREKQEAIRDEKRKQHHKVHRKLEARTPKGQPIMKNKIDFLLQKIESKKDVYCP